MDDDPSGNRNPLLKQDRLIGIGTLAVCAFLFWNTFSFPETNWDALGIAFWPRFLLGSMALIGVFLVVRGVVVPGFEPIDWRGGIILCFAFAYVFLLETVGFLLLTAPAMFLAVMLIGRRWTLPRVIEALAVALVGTFTVYFVFQEALLVRLPEGLLQ